MIQRHTPGLVLMWITSSSQNKHPPLATTADKQIIVGKVSSAIANILVQITACFLIPYGSRSIALLSKDH